MKILVVNASAFSPSITEGFCQQFEAASAKLGIRTERLNLHETYPDVCDGTYSRPEMLSDFHEQTIRCDGLFVATPCHWFNVPGVLKNYIDHMTRIEHDLMKRSRPLCVAVYSPEGGEYGTLSSIILPLNLLGFSIPAWGYAYFNGGDRWAYPEIEQMPERMEDLFDPEPSDGEKKEEGR